MTNGDRSGLDTPLTPLRFLERAVEVHPEKEAAVDGARRITYRELAATVTRLANALRASGLGAGERVAYLSSNSFELLVAHFAVPLAGGVLVAINTRLAPAEVQYICDHSGATILVGDPALLAPLADVPFQTVGEVVQAPEQDGSYTGSGTRYDDVLARGDDTPIPWEVDDENAVITINYTSGTTGKPKGVMYTHRGAYLASLGNAMTQGFTTGTRYLWTLPMFHCNGWCGPWSVTAVAGTHVCLRAVRGDDMWRLIDTECVNQMSGAPTVLTTLATAGEAHAMDRRLAIATAGAPPSPTIIRAIGNLGIELIHVYGLTETYGPYSVCEPAESWSDLSDDERAVKMARQGVGMVTADRMRVVLPQAAEDGSLIDVAADGVQMGEIVMRGNVVMKGYFEDPEKTAEAFAGGWFHSGDLGVMHPDGYVQLLDRAKDVIISGGENISTIEVEQAVVSHPAVLDVAVVGVPDDKWGERPKAYAVLRPGAELTEAEAIAHVKTQIASYKAPREVEFVDDLPKTSTGKIRKNELRDAAWGDAKVRIQG
ncbi:AMP-binding protein [Gordonia hydrophobica]|uniref:AMP-binding protein n=1 Tax=Gordonia hydrophobica TaxID=40516 RepID=A0ABZ2TY02_9ACTN|nr:AMP-binding protein [Gordonia hydrophobica]MBM7366498.1 fatty-acyl-CoA synthase [Gordonia hydrophobica]